MEFEDLVDPSHTVLLLVECQNGVIGPESSLPALAEAAAGGLGPALGELAAAARAAGVRVVHGLAMVRPDGWGASGNARLFGAARKAGVQQHPGTRATEPIDEVGYAAESDVLLPRFHGLAPTSGTELDRLLRNERVTTVVVAGVSLNIAIPNTVFDLVNAGYQVVVPADAVLAVPPEYGDAVLEHTLSLVATLVDVAALASAWGPS